MKLIILTTCVMFLLMQASGQQIQPSAKVAAAFTATQISALSVDQLQALNTRGEKLCWFETVKDSSQPLYQLTKPDGTQVTLTPGQIEQFNPLLYTLPQQALKCENLLIQATDGSFHLLVVRSEDMMNDQLKRSKLSQSKKQAK